MVVETGVTIENQYLSLAERVLQHGEEKPSRAGDTISIFGAMLKHDMKVGFPLLTTKEIRFRNIAIELEGFIKGITDKRWYQERGCRIWDPWCNPEKVAHGEDELTKKRMQEERDLGPIYGFQWRRFGANYRGCDADYGGEGIDQLSNLVITLKENPFDRRMVVSAWNPRDFNQMALPPCHTLFQVYVSVRENLKTLNLLWYQRSVDLAVGLPYNIASYALLLHLLALESGMREGELIAFLGDVHVYKNHTAPLKRQLKRKPFDSPKIITENFKSIFEWEHKDTVLVNYNHHPFIKYEINV